MNILFVCVQNAGRSQMAEVLFARAAQGRHEARSAGSAPAAEVHLEVVEAMRDLDVDLSGRRPRHLTDELARWADVIVTMGCGNACPYVPGVRYVEWDLMDPHGLPLDEVRALRDDIDRRVRDLVDELDRGAA